MTTKEKLEYKNPQEMYNALAPKECIHQFWKDGIPPQCMNCGKTKDDLFKEREVSINSSLIAEIKEWAEKHKIHLHSEGYDNCLADLIDFLDNLTKEGDSKRYSRSSTSVGTNNPDGHTDDPKEKWNANTSEHQSYT